MRRPLGLLVLVAIVAAGGVAVYFVLRPEEDPVRVERDLMFPAADGTSLLVDVYVARDAPEDPAPAVILVHGGGFTIGDKADVGPIAREIAQQGWIAVAPAYRLDVDPRFPTQVDDIASAVHWVRDNAAVLSVDPARIALAGFSAGGTLAAYAATRGSGPTDRGDRVVGFVSWSGLLDLPAIVPGPGAPIAGCSAECQEGYGDGRGVLAYLGCLQPDCPDSYRAASPVAVVDPTDPPGLLANGSRELVPTSQAESMARALEAAGVDHDLLIVDGNLHADALRSEVMDDTLSVLADRFGAPRAA